MTVYSSTQPGPVSDPATWGGNSPGEGDQVIISHAVNQDIDWTIGNNPNDSTTLAIDVASTGSFSVDEFFTLTTRGATRLFRNTQMTMQQGSTWNLSASNSVANTIKLTDANYQNGLLQCNGTANNPCRIEAIGGGTIYPGVIGGRIQATHTTFSRFSGLTHGIYLWPGTGQPSSFTDCIFERCENVRITGYLVREHVVTFTRCTWINSAGLYSVYVSNIDPAPTSWDLTFDTCYLDKRYRGEVTGVTFNNTVMKQSFASVSYAAPGVTSIDGCVFRVYPSGRVYAGTGSTVANSLFTHELTNATDSILFNEIGGSMTVDGCLVDRDQDTGSSQIHWLRITDNNAITLSNCITLRASDGGPVCDAVRMGTSSGTRDVSKCTFFRNGVTVGYGNVTTPPGALLQVKDCIVWGEGGSTAGYLARDQGTSPDVAAAANVDYNAYHLIGAPYAGLQTSGGDPGANDVEADPDFFDPHRNMISWSQSLGGPSTHSEIYDEFANMNLATGIPGFTPGNLIAYLKDGFKPQNPSYKSASDGTTRGAMSLVSIGDGSQCDATNDDGTSTVKFTWTEVPAP